ncbi:MAG: protein translocase subunit SecD [Actinomycetes bacterium]
MAAPTPTPRPGRALAVIAIGLVALYAWMFISGNHSPKLGIDLAGGTSVTLAPKVPEGETGTVTDTAVDQAVNIIRNRVDGLGVAESTVTRQGTGAGSTILVEVPGKNQKDLGPKIGKTAKMSFRKVLLSCPTGVVAAPSPSATASGTTSPSASPTSSTAVTPAPSATSSSNGRPATGLKAGTSSASPSPSSTPSASAATTGDATATCASGLNGPTSATVPAVDAAAYDALDCTKATDPNTHPSDIAKENLVTCSVDGTEKYILGPQIIPGSDVSSSSAILDTGSNGGGIPTWTVLLNFNSDGAKVFGDTTRELYAQPSGTDANRFAVVLDGQVQTAPGVNGAILNGQAQITGNFTQQTATDLANVLNYGALPLAFTVQQQQAISATLGSDYLYAGVLAGLVGLLLVAVYLMVYYRGLGLVALASLVIAGLLTYGSLVLLGQTIGYTLSLAGIAGAIVSIGITADSFVVFFERIRDEMRDGRSMRVAVEQGWRRARRTILAADAVSFIAAVTLYLLAVGNVQGFAFTLGLTTIIDVVVVFLFTKPLLTRLARTKFFGEGNRWSGVDPERLGIKRRTPAASRRTTPKEA